MRITDVQALGRTEGIRVVPALSDYDGHSERWIEAEYRAHPRGTQSVAGYWEGEPGWVRIDVWPYTEICVMIAGRVAIEDAEGALREFGAGEAFLVPAGFSGRWHTLETSQKYFIGIVPDAAPRA
ncbi:cupin domain-containing protein [Leucobacter allii]|uniref:cupin domain-containing protein n=1 Tax=Leucobacter allii TaxID=2932247 RepID=UPI001FCFD101|nr:cupin domain-containing protein [Leucobacter allii]UOR01942.1 cupin domain-containing protein [Leucobacter allii]